MTANELRAVIKADLLGGPTHTQLTEFANRVANAAPELYDQVIADMRQDGSIR